ncbi:prolipoprotein diacylglyceryl transferase [Engelhardtia mirabilis]|uniref:Phosphatidylglycerol--prolipoprotein diacylglyceryl transferase n=1 Tax=Engelhardtia mirabilis TaxID=2528011 RepID=A0A518BHC1_9BACT|nr:Prolipoprotein diacylglyceryl transferase [Planctomycetes bacterium Pla133]QDV00707.1 Prolipoprotein diacylglyceryl transferase [Planctomycetes bacterium Pla86]
MTFDFPTWDPVLFDLPGPVDVRWYGLMYIVGFVIAQWIVTRLARARFLPVDPQRVGDLMVALLIGVIIGGRMGYALFYDQGLVDPIRIFELWRGGMSFHGGLIGVFVAFTWWSRKNSVPWLRLGDACALCVTPGILAVRFANFINGELYGRVTEATTFGAMRFPTDAVALTELGLAGIEDTRSKELALQVAVGHRPWESVADRLAPAYSDGTPIPWDAIRPRLDWERAAEAVPFRHPSQLYEGLSEGLLLGLVLLLAYLLLRRRPLGPGGYGGIFLAGYGVARFLLEYVRQPDSQFTSSDDPVGTVLFGMTMGQTLSSAMVLTGAYFIWRGLRTRANAGPDSPAGIDVEAAT